VGLTSEQIRNFHNSGFLAVREPVLDAAELRHLRALYDHMFAERAGRADGNQFDLAGPDEDDAPARLSQILHPQRYYPALQGPYVDTIHRMCRQLLGDEANTEIFHAILMPAAIGASTPWHQDEAYWKPDRQYRSVSVWIALQEVTEDNGCLWFNDGSHEWEVLEHRSIGGDTRTHGLEIVDTSVIRNAIACPLPAGGFTIHRNRTAHFAGPNRTGAARRALVLSSTLPDRPYPIPRRFPWNEVKNTRRKARAGGDAGTDHT
jgi:hypothetical protein